MGNHIEDLFKGKIIEYKGNELRKDYKVEKLKYLVVGTGRCGTVYAAKLLSSIGFPCGHEAIFSYDGLESAIQRIKGEKPINLSLISKLAHMEDERHGIEWLRDESLVADSSYMAAPFIGHECLKDTKIIHMVRNPFKVINSFVVGFNYFNKNSEGKEGYREYHNFIYSHISINNLNLDQISKCALYYVMWNEMIENLSKDRDYLFYRIEDDPKPIFDFLDINPTEYYKNNKSNHKPTQKKIQSFSGIKDKFVRERLISIADKYGYSYNKLYI